MSKFAAPQLHNLEIDGRINSFRPSCITEQSQELLNTLLNLLKQIKPIRDDDLWQFWVKVPRGGIENFGDYESLHDLGEYDSYEEFEADWKEWYPKDEYWYEITIASHDGFSAISVNNGTVININPRQSQTGYDDYTDFLQFLIDEVNRIIKELKDGTYNKRIAAEFPTEYRTGVISRNALISIVPKIKDYTWDGLTFDEVVKFAKNSMDEQSLYYEKYPEKIKDADEKTLFETIYNIMKSGKIVERMPTMTANEYFNICAICYNAAQYSDLEGKTPREMYNRYADNRDGGIREIDGDSSDVFDSWYSDESHTKNDYANSSHQWEISAGSSHTRIHLYLSKDDRGYYLSLAGGVYACTADVVRMYNALREKGYPVFYCSHITVRDKLVFMDEVGIVPITDRPYQYWYGGFPKNGISTYIQLSPDDFSDEEIERISAATHWFDIPQLSLKE